MIKYFSRFETLVTDTRDDLDLYYKTPSDWSQDWCEKLCQQDVETDAYKPNEKFWGCDWKDVAEDFFEYTFRWIAETFLVRILALHNAVLVEDDSIHLITPREMNFLTLKTLPVGSDWSEL